MIRQIFTLLAVLLLGGFMSQEARAEMITFDFTATVTQSENNVPLTGGSIPVSSSLTGSYTFDSDAVDVASGDPDLGQYQYGTQPNGITVQAGSNVFQTDPNNVDFRITAQDGVDNTINFDRYEVQSFNNLWPLTLPPGTVVDALGNLISIQMQGLADFITGDGLPLLPPPLLVTPVLHMYAFPDSPDPVLVEIHANLDSLTLRPPPTPEENLAALANKVMNLNLKNGISNSLDSKLDAALGALDDVNENNDVAACNTLSSFINAVEAQSGNQIPSSDADDLISDVMEIQEQLGCN